METDIHYQDKEDYFLEAIRNAKVDENAYFIEVIKNDIKEIVGDIRDAHSKDTESAVDMNIVKQFAENMDAALERKEDPVMDTILYFFSKEIGLPLARITDEERAVLSALFTRGTRYKKDLKKVSARRKKRKNETLEKKE